MRFLFGAAVIAAGIYWWSERGVAAAKGDMDMYCGGFKGKDWIIRCETDEAVCYVRGGDAGGAMQCKFK